MNECQTIRGYVCTCTKNFKIKINERERKRKREQQSVSQLPGRIMHSMVWYGIASRDDRRHRRRRRRRTFWNSFFLSLY